MCPGAGLSNGLPVSPADKRAGLARQFGVAQQQIATWFQNRRARQRKKQLQQDFELLKKCLRAAFLENQALRREVSPAAGGGQATTAGGPSLGSPTGGTVQHLLELERLNSKKIKPVHPICVYSVPSLTKKDRSHHSSVHFCWRPNF